MRGGLLRAAGVGGWGGGLRFPCAETTGATISGSRTTVPVPTISGTNWTWIGSPSFEVKIQTNGAAVSNLDIAGSLLIQANNVTVSNCTVAGTVTVGSTSAGTTLSNLRVTNSGVSAACITLGASTSNTTVSRCTLSGYDGSLGRVAYGVQDNSGDPGTIVEDCNIYWWRVGGQAAAGKWQRNYIHDCGFLGADHTDGIDIEGTNGGPLLIQGNTILTALDQTAAIHQNTFTGGTAITNLTVDGNLVAGGGFAVYGGNSGPLASSGANIVFSNNWFSTMVWALGGQFGAGTAWNNTATGNVWAGNRWLDGASAGQTIPHP